MKVTDLEPGTIAKCELCEATVKIGNREVFQDEYIVVARELGYWEVDILCESCEEEAENFFDAFNEDEWVIFLNEDISNED